MNDLDFTNRLDASLNRGMLSVPLPAVEPASARYRIAVSKLGRRPMFRLALGVAAVGMALLLGLAGSDPSGASPAYLLSATVHKVVVFVEQMTTPAGSGPATLTGAAGVAPASAREPRPATAPQYPDRASELSENPSPEVVSELSPVAATPEPSAEPSVESTLVAATPDPPAVVDEPPTAE
jgi:outer membrane biosynthesis protein TonB